MKVKDNELIVYYNVGERVLPKMDKEIIKVLKKYGFHFWASGYGCGERELCFDKKDRTGYRKAIKLWGANHWIIEAEEGTKKEVIKEIPPKRTCEKVETEMNVKDIYYNKKLKISFVRLKNKRSIK